MEGPSDTESVINPTHNKLPEAVMSVQENKDTCINDASANVCTSHGSSDLKNEVKRPGS